MPTCIRCEKSLLKDKLLLLLLLYSKRWFDYSKEEGPRPQTIVDLHLLRQVRRLRSQPVPSKWSDTQRSTFQSYQAGFGQRFLSYPAAGGHGVAFHSALVTLNGHFPFISKLGWLTRAMAVGEWPEPVRRPNWNRTSFLQRAEHEQRTNP